jgi:hypothetical protein
MFIEAIIGGTVGLMLGEAHNLYNKLRASPPKIRLLSGFFGKGTI